MFAPCISSIKTLFIVPTDAHYYKNRRECLKQFKIITIAPACFGSHRNHHQGAVLCLAETTKYGLSVLVGIDTVNVMAACFKHSMIFIIVCISWNNKKCFDTTDARCKHEDYI